MTHAEITKGSTMLALITEQLVVSVTMINSCTKEKEIPCIEGNSITVTRIAGCGDYRIRNINPLNGGIEE